jgi:hypothetical protein
MVTEGAIYADTQWKLTTDDPIVIGTTPLTFIQNYSANSIASGNSNVVVNANANVTISSAGTANVVLVSSTGIVVAGNIVPSANVTYSLGTTSQRFSNLWLSNTTIYLGAVNLSATETTLTINGANVLVGNAGAAFSTSGNITGGNILTDGSISATGNVTAGNVLPSGLISATGNVTGGNILTDGSISATGNVTAGNVLPSGLISATGNVTGGNIIGPLFSSGNTSTISIVDTNFTLQDDVDNTKQARFQASGIATGTTVVYTLPPGSANASTLLDTVTTQVITAQKTFTAATLNLGNSTANSTISLGYGATLNSRTKTLNIGTAGVAGSNTVITVGTDTGNGNVTFTANTTVSIANTSGTALSVAGGITTTGVITGNTTISLTGNSVAIGYAAGNITTNNYSVAIGTNAGNLQKVYAVAIGSEAGYQNQGANAVAMGFAAGRDTQGANAVAIGVYAGTFLQGSNSIAIGYQAGLTSQANNSIILNATGSGLDNSGDANSFFVSPIRNNISNVANILFYNASSKEITYANTVSLSGNISGGNILTAGIMSSTGNATAGNVVTSGIMSSTGNAIHGNILTGGLVSATGNVTGNYFLGNGSQLTGIVVSAGAAITNGNSNVAVAANANVTVGVGGSSNIAVFATTGEYITGVVSATGNVTGNYILGNGALLTGVITSVANINNGTSNVTVVSSGGNVTVGVSGTANVVQWATTGEYVTGVVSSSGNVTGANILTAGLVSATGTITGNNLITTGGLSITGNTITASGATIIIDPNGSGGIDGAVVIAGNLSVQGNVTYIDSNVITTNEKSITLANNVSTGAAADGAGIDVGNVTIAYWRFNNATTSWQSNIGLTPAANATLNLGGTSNYWANVYATSASVSGNITSGNVSTTSLTGTTVSVSGTTTAASVVGGVITGSSTSVTGTTTAASVVGGVITGSSVSVTGNITGSYILGNGSQLSGITAGLTWTTVANTAPTSPAPKPGDFWYNSYTDVKYQYTNDGTANYWVDQSYPTSFSTLAVTGAATVGTTLNVTGNVAGGNILTGGLISATGNITGGNILTVGLISATGNITGSNIIGNGYFLTSINGANVTGLNTAAISNGTSNVTIATSGGNILVGVGGANIVRFTSGGIENAQANSTGNIGNATSYFNTVFAKATSAQYADLAEYYVTDQAYPPGTVLVFGGTAEVTVSDQSHDTRTAGVVSTDPAYIMNATATGLTVPVALTGRVPCQVLGPVNKGDRLVNIQRGVAGRLDLNLYQPGAIIGKSLEDVADNTIKIIEIAVGRY